RVGRLHFRPRAATAALADRPPLRAPGPRRGPALRGQAGTAAHDLVPAAQPHASAADEGTAGRHLLPQRDQLLRQGNPARPVPAHGAAAAAGRPAVPRAFREPVQGIHGVDADRQDGLPAQRGAMLNARSIEAGGSGIAARSYDSSLGCWATKVQPGEFYITVAHPEEAITTVLGSCVAACIRDPEAAIGGM